MGQFVIGLDFGTYQSKVCINHLDKIPSLHEFFEFKNSGNSNLFLPSCVFLLKDGTFRYGNYSGDDILRTFNYFKIASAEDPIFHLLTDYKESLYNSADNFGEFAPEFLSVIYITSILLDVKDYLKLNALPVKKKFSLASLFGKKTETEAEQVESFVRLGVPTEWNKKINLARRRKFEMILLISEIIQKHLEYSHERYLALKKAELLEMVKRVNDDIKNSKDNFYDLLGQHKISVSPESAAGLLYLIQTKKLNRGLYAAIDIGGGTSDISFFNIDFEHRVKYLASESLMVACNNIYLGCSKKADVNQVEICRIEKEIISLIELNGCENDSNYIRSTNKVKSLINKELKILFCDPVWHALVPKFEYRNVLKAFDGKPCIVYGGGIKHPKLKSWEKILIFDNGSTQVNLQPYSVDNFIPDRDKVKNPFNKWSQDFYMLVVAFGLSYLRHDSEAEEWDDSHYVSTNAEKKMIEVPHPINEDYYIYDVIDRQWYDRK